MQIDYFVLIVIVRESPLTIQLYCVACSTNAIKRQL
ncbi:hypothetical protein QF041_000743 [Paenibacillus sp. W2I17]|nr:hypothetical protein [Paenibacillus sp. W2I17]